MEARANGNGGVATSFLPLVERIDRRADGGRGFRIEFWDGSSIEPTSTDGEVPTVRLASPDAVARIVHAPGELGFSRAWVSGDLEVEGDLGAALAATEDWHKGHLRPTDLLPAAATLRETGLLRRPAPQPPTAEARLHGRLHGPSRDRDAISHHYDLSNDFYRRMLGPTMVYSCALFGSDDESLDAAQRRKLDLICRKLELRPGLRLLDVGCGWGSLLIHAAGLYGVRAVGVTLSTEQADLARERIERAGLSHLCEVRVEDYRDVADGPYDRIASVGMFEHVGERNLALYFDRVRELMAPDGLFLNHGIVRTAPGRRRRATFSQRYVFPDGELHTQGRVVEAVEEAGFELIDDESLRHHYARTLRCWAANHDAHRSEAVAEIGGERERVWRLHNHGAALSFERGRLSVHQVLASSLAGNRRRPLAARSWEPQATEAGSRSPAIA